MSWVLTGEEELSHCFGFLCAVASGAWLGRGVPRSSPSESTAPSCSGFNLLADRDLQAWRGRLVAPPSGSMRQPLSFLYTSPCEQGTKLSFEQSKMGCGRAERKGRVLLVRGKASVKVWRLGSECFSHFLCTVCLLLLKRFQGGGQESTHPSAMTMCARPLLCPETVGTRRTQTPVIGDGRGRMR